MIDDEHEHHVAHKEIAESQCDEFARSVRIRDAARCAFIAVDMDQRLRRAAVSASRPTSPISHSTNFFLDTRRCRQPKAISTCCPSTHDFHAQ